MSSIITHQLPCHRCSGWIHFPHLVFFIFSRLVRGWFVTSEAFCRLSEANRETLLGDFPETVSRTASCASYTPPSHLALHLAPSFPSVSTHTSQIRQRRPSVLFDSKPAKVFLTGLCYNTTFSGILMWNITPLQHKHTYSLVITHTLSLLSAGHSIFLSLLLADHWFKTNIKMWLMFITWPALI